MLHKRRSFGTRKVSPPQPTCMTEDQKATYLKSLRSTRPARPTGSRPLPVRSSISHLDHEYGKEHDVPKIRRAEHFGVDTSNSKRTSLPNSNIVASARGRPLVTAQSGTLSSRKVTPPDIEYRESALRQREKIEAHSLRRALEEMDLHDEDLRIHKAAQLEAADLVWKHRNPISADKERNSPYPNPDQIKTGHDRKATKEKYRSVSGSSAEVVDDTIEPLQYMNGSTARRSRDWSLANEHGDRRRSSAGRKSSSGSSKGVFRNPNDEIYEEPEEFNNTMRQSPTKFQPLRTRNPNPSIRGSRPLPSKPDQTNVDDHYKMLSSEPRDAAHNNIPHAQSHPTQSMESTRGRILEIRSDEIRAATSMKRSDRSPNLPTPTVVSDTLGRPIVSFDPSWRPNANTGRGQNGLEPSPEQSLNPNQGMISSPRYNFAPTGPKSGAWKKPSAVTVPSAIPIIMLPEAETVEECRHNDDKDQRSSISSSTPQITVSGSAPDDSRISIPSINVDQSMEPNRPLPSIMIATDGNNKMSDPSPKPMLRQGLTLGSSGRVKEMPWLTRHSNVPTIGGSRPPTVACSACDLPISGRIVTASEATNKHQARFHPQCFTCYHCSERLECASFYPEPESSRAERLALLADQDPFAADVNARDIHDTDLRFYCHLDYHDLFSPRCGSCHTPIEGVVIVAAGKSWHEGHFFCAECGDPFSSTSPFVETQGYAYCVDCHTKRTSARCKACKKQILDDVTVEALGGKWHEECFRCDECSNDFGESGTFFVREVDIELTEKEKRRGVIYRKVEERAVCDGCEAKRLKSKDVAAFL